MHPAAPSREWRGGGRSAHLDDGDVERDGRAVDGHEDDLGRHVNVDLVRQQLGGVLLRLFVGLELDELGLGRRIRLLLSG